MNDQIPVGLLASLDTMIVERTGEATYKLLEPTPRFFSKIFHRALSEDGFIDLEGLPFLAHFLEEAEVFWATCESGCLEAGPWIEVDDRKQEHYLSVTATSLKDKKYLVLTRNDRNVLERQARLQSCRTMLLKEREVRRGAEFAIELGEERFRTLVEAMNEAFGIEDEHGIVTYANNRLCRMLRYSKHEIVGRRFAEFLDEESKSTLASQFDKRRKGRAGSYEVTFVRKDGVRVNAIVSGAPIFDHEKNFKGSFGIAIEITERRRMEEALRESEERYRDLFENAHDAIYTHDLQGNFTSANKAAELLMGIKREQLLTLNLRDLVAPEYLPAVEEHLLKDIDEGVDETGPYEIGIRRLDGVRRWIEVKSRIIRKDGQPYAIHGIARDITDRRLAEEALRESENKYRTLIEFAPDGVFVQVGETIEFANSAMAAMMGVDSPERLKGIRALDLVHPEFHETSRSRMAQNLEGGKPVPLLEQKLVRLDGTVFDVEAVAAPISYKGQRARQVLVRDISERKQAEENLRRSQAMISSILNSVPLSIFWKDRSGVYLGCNQVFAQAVGLQSPDEIVGRTDYELPWSTERADGYLAEDREVLTYNKPRRHIIEPVQAADGTRQWIDTTKVPLTEENGAVYGILGVSADITERKKTEDAIKNIVEGVSGEVGERFFESSVKHFAEILEADYTLIGEIQEGNQGRSVSTLAFCAGNELQDNFEYDLKGAPCEEVVEKGLGSFPNGATELFPLDKALKENNIDAYVGVCLHDSQNSPVGIMAAMYSRPLENVEFAEAVLRIFASRAAAEIERRKSNEDLQRLFTAVEQAGETVMITDQAARILYVNPAFEKTTGYSSDEVVGKTPSIVKSGKHDRALYDDLWATVRGGEVWRGQFTNRKKDGTLYEETVTISPIKDKAGRTGNFVMVGRDVTAETTLQKQLLQAQKMEAVGTLAGGIAHDFNNLLQAILGYTDLLLMNKPPEDPDRKKLEVVQRAARDGADLVSRILTFSRKAETKIRPIDLNQEIHRIEKLLRRTLPKMIRIDMKLAKDLRIIDADPAHIEQVLLNLGGNAQHAMPDGGQLLIETRNVSLRDQYLRSQIGAKPGHYVLLSVSDTGLGMESKVLDRVFEPFFTTKKDGEGTGLGLSMVHGIVSQHGGYIKCYSEYGKGTSFKIYLPVSASERSSSLAMTREMPAFGTETVLLVEDDDRIREMTRQMIEMGGYQVITARSGEEAFETYTRHGETISLVILDLIMPGIGGQRCLEQLLGFDPNVRVLLASGYSSNGLTAYDKEAGARGFITKPYDAKDILGAIRKVLDEGRL